jgi:hypothetical protein
MLPTASQRQAQAALEQGIGGAIAVLGQPWSGTGHNGSNGISQLPLAIAGGLLLVIAVAAPPFTTHQRGLEQRGSSRGPTGDHPVPKIAKPIGGWGLGGFCPARDGVMSEQFGSVALLGRSHPHR